MAKSGPTTTDTAAITVPKPIVQNSGKGQGSVTRCAEKRELLMV